MVSGDFIGVRTPLLENPPGWVDFADLMQDCWETVRLENNGSPNVFGMADRMYDRILSVNACSLVPQGIDLPDRGSFIYNVQLAMLQPELFAKALYPGATEAVDRMNRAGPVLFWTTGDMYGGSDADGRKLPGSMEQFVRVMSSGLIGSTYDRARREDRRVHPFNIAGAEDKFALLPACFEWLSDHGAGDIVVLEDKPQNLIVVQGHAAEREVPANLHLVWLRQGKHGDTGEEAPDGMYSLPNIADFPVLLESLNLERPGFLVDYDGVVSNDERRQYLQQLSVWNMLCGQGWLQGEQFEARN